METKKKSELLKILFSGLSPIKKISVSEWADLYRQLPTTSAEPGRWKTSRVPYMREIMNAFTESKIRRVVAMLASQTGKSEAMLNVIGRFAQIDPCNIMLIQPTLEMAADISKDRLAKMISDTKTLTTLFNGEEKTSKTRKSEQTILSKVFKGGRLVLAGANSAAGLASRPIRILLCDEVDRFPPSAGNNEGDPVNLAAKRCTTYWNYKIGLFSTPTTAGASRIEREYLSGTQEEWQHKCPNCGEFHKLDERNFFTHGTEIKYRCPDCGFVFSEKEMKRTPQKYVAKKPENSEKGIRSFWVNAFSSPWISWRDIWSEWEESRGDPEQEKVVVNTRFAESYEDKIGEYENADIFLSRLKNYEAEVPAEVKFLTAAVDVQANRLEYEVCGWGENYKKWGIQRGVLLGVPTDFRTWRQLDAVIKREYFLPNGGGIKILRTFIDSGYATQIVYEYCRANAQNGVFAIKGTGAAGKPLIAKISTLSEQRVTVVSIGVNDGKQQVFNSIGEEDYWVYPREDRFLTRNYDEIYFKQLIAEKRVVKFVGGTSRITFEPIRKHERNESLDLAVYNLACAKTLSEEIKKPVSTAKKNKKRTFVAEIF